MTFREEVLMNSGLLTEAVLEEEKFSRAAIIGLMIATLIFGGAKGVQELKDYKNKSAISAIEKYHRADNIASGTDFLSFEKNNIKVYTYYNKPLKQSTVGFVIDVDDASSSFSDKKDDLIKIVNEYKKEVSSACDKYIKELEKRNSNIEKILKTKTYAEVKPVNINIDIVWSKDDKGDYYNGLSKFMAKSIIAKIIPILTDAFQVDEQSIKITFNGTGEKT